MAWAQQFAGIAAECTSFLMSLRDESSGGFRFTPHQPPTLMATAYAVLGLELTGGLARLDAERESRTISFLTECARPDGSFVDPLFDPKDILSEEHDSTYFQEETTTFCQQALDALLAAPPPARCAAGLDWATADGLINRLESFPWLNPWLDSNRVMFILSQLCHEAERHRRTELFSLVDLALDWLDEHQSPKTGLWEGPHAVSLENAMAATFHFIFYYDYRRRPLRHIERLIDSCLGLQRPHGLFSGDSIGHTCLDYDALALLASASLATDYRRRDLCRAMHRASKALLGLHNKDGGFAHCKAHVSGFPGAPHAGRLLDRMGLSRHIPCLPASGKYSVCWRPLSCDTGESNAFSTWFRLLAISLANQEEWIGSDEPPGATFRRLPFLGYHDPLAIQSAHGVTVTDPLTRETEWRHGRRQDGSKRACSPLISVVIPAYNASRYLDAALSSLRSQTYPRWQAIVVNDGSTDDTSTIAGRWARADARIRVIEQVNTGLGAARNTALAHAEGQWIHCLDADDRIEPDFYESILRAFPPDGPDAPGVCAFSSVRAFRGSGRIVSARKALPEADFSFHSLSLFNPGEPVCSVFERRILQMTGTFDESLRHCHDWDLWLRFARMGVKYVPVQAARAWYRVLPGSLSTSYVRYVDSAARVLRRAASEDPRCPPGAEGSHPVSEGHTQRAVANFWFFNLLRTVNAGNENASAELLAWARENLPAGFWADPGAFGLVPAIDWAGNPPPPARAIEARWRITLQLLDLQRRHWPEFPVEWIAHITGRLAYETVVRMSKPGERLPLHRYLAVMKTLFLSDNLAAWDRRHLAMVLACPFVPRPLLGCITET